ncbi:MAG TPA: FeoB-associated Cys-rich membrane protein [Sedimentibacter sp.]|nr:FeoB-associated Cys-rich membrane protein [Sedimentibacter sp.]
MFIRRNQLYIIIAVIVFLMAAFIIYSIYNKDNSKDESKDVIVLVEDFGSTLKNVSLLAPRDLVIEAIEANYSPYVTDELMQSWLAHPRRAPGRTTSSPWPERIEITEVERLSEGEFSVKGRIVEVTSSEAGGGAAVYRPVELIVRKVGNKWLIDDIRVGNYE